MWLLSTSLGDVWGFTLLVEQVTFWGQGMLSFFKGQVRTQTVFSTIDSLISEEAGSKKGINA